MSINETVRKQYDAFNRHDASAFAASYNPQAVVYDPQYPELLKGSDAITQDIKAFLSAFPDIEAKLTRTVSEGDICAYEVTIRGTHRGPMAGPTGDIPATNKRVEIEGGIFVRLDAQGRIVEEHRHYNLAGLLEQLGVTH